MPQLHFYVPKEIADEIRRRAEVRGITLSRYVAELVQQEIGGGWPDGYFRRVVGRWSCEPLERAGGKRS